MEGYELVEVFRVFVEINKPCNLYGRVSHEGCDGDESVYKKEREEAQPVKPGRTALFLVGPSKPLQGMSRENLLKVELKHVVNGGECGDPSSDEVVCKGISHWDSITLDRDKRDTLLKSRIHGVGCTAEICYAVYANAHFAHVIVRLVNSRRVAKVFGQVCAGSSWIADDVSRKIFDQNEGSGADIEGAWEFQLCSSLVAVPVSSVLFVCLSLWGSGKELEPVQQIAKVIEGFSVRGRGTSRKTICSGVCDVEVEIVWHTYR